MARIHALPLNIDLFAANPGAATVTPTGGASGNYTYKLVARTTNGTSAAGTAASISNGPTTLDGTHYTTIDPTGLTNPGAASYDVYRTAGGSTQGKIGNIANDGVTTLRDNGLVADGATAPASNTTGLGTSVPVG